MAFRPKAKTAPVPAAVEPVPTGVSSVPPLTPRVEPVEPIAPQPVAIAQPVPLPVMQQPVAPVIPQQVEQPQVWTVTEVPTETQRVISNNNTGETLEVDEALCRILNLFEEIKEE